MKYLMILCLIFILALSPSQSTFRHINKLFKPFFKIFDFPKHHKPPHHKFKPDFHKFPFLPGPGLLGYAPFYPYIGQAFKTVFDNHFGHDGHFGYGGFGEYGHLGYGHLGIEGHYAPDYLDHHHIGHQHFDGGFEYGHHGYGHESGHAEF